VTESALFSFCGGGHQIIINETEVSSEKPILIHSGCTIRLIPASTCVWSYVGIGGGFQLQKTLESKSTYLTAGFGGLEGRALKSGDELVPVSNGSSITKAIIKSLSVIDKEFVQAKWSIEKLNQTNNSIRITAGPEWNWLSKSQREKLIKKLFTVANDSNRMGYRLRSKPILRQVNDEMISSGVTKGTIQLTNEGSLIVLMADSQTVGGYPRIAQVAAVDLPLVAQMRPATELKFELITNEDAEQLLLISESDFRKLRTAIQLKVL
jgi:antagonist of KipI